MSLAGERTFVVNASLSRWARRIGTQALIDINTLALGILYESNAALLFGRATEGSVGVLTDEICRAVMNA